VPASFRCTANAFSRRRKLANRRRKIFVPVDLHRGCRPARENASLRKRSVSRYTEFSARATRDHFLLRFASLRRRRTRLAVQRKLAGNRRLPSGACLENNLWCAEGVLLGNPPRRSSIRARESPCQLSPPERRLDACPGEKHLAAFIDKALEEPRAPLWWAFPAGPLGSNIVSGSRKLGWGALPARNVVASS